jgi:hypothetical protein
VSGWWVIRASDAHSWVEAWIGGRGWVTYDPTPPDPNARALTVWSKLGLYIDAAQTFWREWVLNYDLSRQVNLALNVEESGRMYGSRWLDRLRLNLNRWGRAAAGSAGPYVGTLLGAAAALLAMRRYGPRLLAWWAAERRVREVQRGAARASDATLLYARMLAMLKRRGFEKPAWLTPSEFARLLPASPAAALVADFTLAYNDLRFGGNTAAAPRLILLLAELEAAPAPAPKSARRKA